MSEPDIRIEERLRCLRIIEARMLEILNRTQHRPTSDEERETNLRVYRVLNDACQQIRNLPMERVP